MPGTGAARLRWQRLWSSDHSGDRGFGRPRSLPITPVIQIGGFVASVSFAGLISPGLYQFNVVAPPNAPDGDNALTAQYNGAKVQSGTLLTIQK